MKCKDCERTFLVGDYIIYTHHGCHCVDQRKCFERREKYMPNIKITAEIDGKQVPLENISTKTFEAIKALEKPKEIPVPAVAVGNFPGCPEDRRLFLKITTSLKRFINEKNIKMVAIDMNGYVTKSWKTTEHGLTFWDGVSYENIKPL